MPLWSVWTAGAFCVRAVTCYKPAGRPQSRERVLIVSIRKDVDDGKFSFPATVPLTTCMGDYLDDEVPEQFYLSEDKTQSVITHNAAHPGHIGDRGGDMPHTPVKGLQRPEGGEMQGGN